MGVPDGVIRVAGANVPLTAGGPQTDPEKVMWYVDMIVSNTEISPLMDRLDKVEAGWDGKQNGP